MKHVAFNLELNTISETYSSCEYDRVPDLSLALKRRNNLLSDNEWNSELEKLNVFKTHEMVVHKGSICNTKLHF